MPHPMPPLQKVFLIVFVYKKKFFLSCPSIVDRDPELGQMEAGNHFKGTQP